MINLTEIPQLARNLTRLAEIVRYRRVRLSVSQPVTGRETL